jgi:hypothetical protein
MSDTHQAVEHLLRSVCAAEGSDAFVREWGEAQPSARAPRRVHIEHPAVSAFAALEVRPWDGGATGGIVAWFATGTAPAFSELENWFGPFKPVPPSGPGPLVWEGRWSQNSLPAAAALLVERPDDLAAPVAELTVLRARSGPRR